MTVWFWSDLHIGHAKIAEIRGFTNPADHDEYLAAMWDMNVRQDDQVWLLGDNSSGTTPATKYALQWISQRPGTKHLVPGNHCPVHPMYRDSHTWFPHYMQVFESVQPFARRKITLPPAGRRDILLSHFPYKNDRDVERCSQYRLKDEGLWLMHGHTHDTTVFNPFHPREIHVGVDAHMEGPVAWDRVVNWVREVESE